MTEKRREMLENIVGVIGWRGFDVEIYQNSDYNFVHHNRYESDPKAWYISLTDFDYWDTYLGKFTTAEERDYEIIYENASKGKKKNMLLALEMAVFDN